MVFNKSLKVELLCSQLPAERLTELCKVIEAASKSETLDLKAAVSAFNAEVEAIRKEQKVKEQQVEDQVKRKNGDPSIDLSTKLETFV